jgi:hypothetical protein
MGWDDWMMDDHPMFWMAMLPALLRESGEYSCDFVRVAFDFILNLMSYIREDIVSN